MKKKSLFLALLVIMIAVITTACSKTEYTLDLPKEAENYTSVTLTFSDGTRTIKTAENIQAVIDKLTATERITTQKELGAVIDENEKIKIDFEFCKGGTSSLYVLQKDDKYYIEQDLNGVYEITKAEYDDILTFYQGLAKELGKMTNDTLIKRTEKLNVVDQLGKSFKTSELTNDEVLRLGYCLFGPVQNFGWESITFEDLQRTYLNGWLGRNDCTPTDITCFCGEVISTYDAATDTYTWDDKFHYLDHSAKAYNQITEIYQIEDRYVVELYKLFPDTMMNSNPAQYNFYPTYNDAVNKTNVLFTVTNEDEFENAVKSVDDSKKTSYTLTFELIKGTYKLVEYKINN